MILEIVLGLITAANKLIERGQQTGELTPEAAAVLRAHAADVFGKYEHAPAPPAPPERPGA